MEPNEKRYQEAMDTLDNFYLAKSAELETRFPYGYILCGNSEYTIEGRQIVKEIDGNRVEFKCINAVSDYKYKDGYAFVRVKDVHFTIYQQSGNNVELRNMFVNGLKVKLVKGAAVRAGAGTGSETSKFLVPFLEVIEADKDNPVFCLGMKQTEPPDRIKAEMADRHYPPKRKSHVTASIKLEMLPGVFKGPAPPPKKHLPSMGLWRTPNFVFVEFDSSLNVLGADYIINATNGPKAINQFGESVWKRTETPFYAVSVRITRDLHLLLQEHGDGELTFDQRKMAVSKARELAAEVFKRVDGYEADPTWPPPGLMDKL